MSSGEQLSREAYKSIGPYSTKTLHKNKQDLSYISIGDPYDRSKRDRNPRWNGTQFSTAFPKKGQIPSKVLFDKKVTFGPFGKLQEAIKYRHVKRDKGFGTSDAMKRDQFTSNMDTERYRTLLGTEKMIQRRTVIKATEVGKVAYNERLGELIKELEEKERQYHDKLGLTAKLEAEKKRDADRQELFQYDYGRKQSTSFNPKKSSDTFYNFDRKNGKRYGKAHSTTLQHGMYALDQGSIKGALTKVDKKAWEFAHNALTETFFDSGHLGVGRALG